LKLLSTAWLNNHYVLATFSASWHRFLLERILQIVVLLPSGFLLYLYVIVRVRSPHLFLFTGAVIIFPLEIAIRPARSRIFPFNGEVFIFSLWLAIRLGSEQSTLVLLRLIGIDD
jgi:integral membrane sensor domain MASE1